MKKIIGIIAAVAMAASVFAFEFQGAISTKTDLFNMTFENGAQPTVIKPIGRGGGNWWGSRFQVNATAEKCGASFVIQLGDWGSANPNLTATSWNIWVQPIDMLKISIFDSSDKLNESFDESLRVIGIGYGDEDGAGVFAYSKGGFSKGGSAHNTVQVSLKPIDELTINLTALTPFVTGAVINEMGLTAKYAADFGTIGFMFYGKSTPATAASTKKTYDANDWEIKADGTIGLKASATPIKTVTPAADGKLFSTLGFGLGYSNTFDMVDFFVDAAALFAPYAPVFFMRFSADAQAIFKLDDIKISVYGIYQNVLYEGSNYAGDLWGILRFDYKLDTAGLYIKLMDKNILQNGNILIKPGVTFNIGAASCDASVELTIPTSGANASISVPVEITVGL